MYNNDTEREVFWETIRELTFTPVVNLAFLNESLNENRIGKKISKCDNETREMYSTLSENLMGRMIFQKEKSTGFYENSYKRLARMFKIFASEISNDSSALSKLVVLPKVYDKYIRISNFTLYNHMAKVMDFSPVEKDAPSLEILLETAFWDNETVDDSVVSKYYPYFYSGERAGVYFIEYILLLNISLTIQSKSLTYLKNALQGIYNENKLKELITTIKESMHSPEIYLTYIDTFFAFLFYYSARYYNKKVSFFDSDDEVSYDLFSCFSNNIDDAIDDTMKSIREADEMHAGTIVIAWKIIGSQNDFNPNKDDDLKFLKGIPGDKIEKANKYVQIINEYITTAVDEAERVLLEIFPN